MVVGATAMSAVCINAFCNVHNFCGELQFVLYYLIRYMLPARRLFFRLLLQTGKANNSLQDRQSYLGRALCSIYSDYTEVIREAEGERRLRVETVLK